MPPLNNTLPNPLRPEQTLNNLPDSYQMLIDPYGPGVFLSWILVFSGVAMHIAVEESPRDTIKYDFIATLAYPITAAVNLIVQVQRFPGSRKELWTTSDEDLAPLTQAMETCAYVCVWGLGINFFLYGCVLIHTFSASVKRVCLLSVSILFTLAALWYSAYFYWWAFYMATIFFFSIAIYSGMLLLSGIAAYDYLRETLHLLRISIASPESFHLEDLPVLISTLLYLFMTLGFGGIIAVTVLMGSWFIPQSTKTLLSFSEVFALSLGITHACFSLVKWYRIYGKPFLMDIQPGGFQVYLYEYGDMTPSPILF
jgi:hypothetical protein